ncbi:hypothetical protein V5O48_018063 [Marasmius crinis-equi]|uniref:Uncharacterized protein n=1 Tax=Marasmius crinis-equi TaxID=585013 RepID=A0ABR3EM72_9AGAR
MSLTYNAKCWRNRIGLRKDISPELDEGLKAYALRQERIQQRLGRSFQVMWLRSLSELEAMDEEDVEEDMGDGAGDDDDITLRS